MILLAAQTRFAVLLLRMKSFGVSTALLLALPAMVAYGAPTSPAAAAASRNCRPAESTYRGDVALLQRKPPTWFRLMPSRYMQIVEAARGKTCTGTVTIAFNGREFFQAGRADDAGIAELIPIVASWLGLSLERSFDVTAALVILLGAAVGFAGYCRMYAAAPLRRAGAFVFLCLALIETAIANVHIFQSSPLIAGIPWVLYFAHKKDQTKLTVAAALLAFVCSWAAIVRIGSGLFCLVFLVTLFICRGPVRSAFLSLAMVALACAPAFLVNHAATTRRDAVLAALGYPVTVKNDHAIWHSIYIGLAFVPNQEVPAYDDQVAIDRVEAIDASVRHTSVAYETILRREVFRLAQHNPMLLMMNLAAKIAIVLLLAAILLAPLRRGLMTRQREWWIDAAFLAVMIVSSMNAILVIPRPPYLLTFVCVTSLYALMRFSSERSAARTSTRN